MPRRAAPEIRAVAPFGLRKSRFCRVNNKYWNAQKGHHGFISTTFDTSADRGSPERRLVEYVDEELQRGRNVVIRSHRGRDARALDEAAVFNLGGRTLGGGTVIKTNGEYGMEFMDHADYASILESVKKASHRYVVTDYARGRQGAKLAEAIRGAGISAIARPTG